MTSVPVLLRHQITFKNYNIVSIMIYILLSAFMATLRFTVTFLWNFQVPPTPLFYCIRHTWMHKMATCELNLSVLMLANIFPLNTVIINYFYII